MFILKSNDVTGPDLKFNINGDTSSEVESVTYLVVTFSNNAKWTAQTEDIFKKCVRLTFFVKKLRRLSTQAEFIRKFIETCVVPLILYCSPAIFPGLLKHDFALLMRSIKLISLVSGLSFSYLTNLLCECHIKASSDIKSHFKLLPSKTAAYRNSVLPALSQLLVDRNAELNHYLQNLSSAYMY